MTAPINLNNITFEKSRFLIYGRPGVGKTIFSANSARHRTFVFDVDDGVISLRTWPNLQKQNVDVWPVKTYADFLNGLNYLNANVRNYGAYVIDSATELQRVLSDEILDKGKKQQMDQQGWGLLLQAMDRTSRNFRQMPLHGVWVCHEKLRENKETGRQSYGPSFQGQFAEGYAKHFDVIARLFLHETMVLDSTTNVQSVRVDRWLQCLPDTRADAKDRYSALDFVEAPSLDLILQKIEAKITIETT